MNDLQGPIVLLGRCGLDRLAGPLRGLTGAEVVVSGFTDVALAQRLGPSLVYVDLFGWDLLGPICAAALTGAPPPLPLGPLRAVVAALEGLPVVYRGLRRPSAGSFGFGPPPPGLQEALDTLEGVLGEARRVDVAGIWARRGVAADDTRFGLGHGEAVGEAAAVAEAEAVAAIWASRTRGPLKCLVVDLDDTLIYGQISHDDFTDRNPAYLPLGEAAPSAALIEGWWRLRRGLHEALREAQRRGILLALATRNDPALVRARFRRRPAEPERRFGLYAWMYDDLPEDLQGIFAAEHAALLRRIALDLDDFIVVEAGFGPKSEMCRRIAETLGIGLDRLGFLDDSAFERAEVAQNAPEVVVFGGEVDGFREQLLTGPYTQVWERVTTPRLDSYKSRAAVVSAASDATDLTGFLLGLELRVWGRAGTEADLPRARELLQRSNQLTLNGARPSLNNVEGLWVGFVTDRLADHGLVAVGLVRGGEVVAFACSCRVLPHRVAGALLGALLQAHPGAVARFEATGRNGAAAGLVEEALGPTPPWVTLGPPAVRLP
ncbi:hypothetical protein L6R49_13595 [Myxococcota bacterium]|nr:hypothetical protein [Myxococcota bacterium]